MLHTLLLLRYFFIHFQLIIFIECFDPRMMRLKRFCPVLPPALFQEQQASCLNVNVCLSDAWLYIFAVCLFT